MGDHRGGRTTGSAAAARAHRPGALKAERAPPCAGVLILLSVTCAARRSKQPPCSVRCQARACRPGQCPCSRAPFTTPSRVADGLVTCLAQLRVRLLCPACGEPAACCGLCSLQAARAVASICLGLMLQLIELSCFHFRCARAAIRDAPHCLALLPWQGRCARVHLRQRRQCPKKLPATHASVLYAALRYKTSGTVPVCSLIAACEAHAVFVQASASARRGKSPRPRAWWYARAGARWARRARGQTGAL